MIRFGATDKLGAAVAPCATDYNGDGLFDLIIGKSTGRIALALNKGTKAEPKFEAPVEIQGTDIINEKINVPANWTFDTGMYRGNIYGYLTAEAEDVSPAGGKVLHCGYFPSPNKVFKLTPLAVNGKDDTDFFRYWREEWEPIPATWAGYTRAADAFLMRENLGPLKVGGTYQLSFKVKGKGLQDGLCTVAYIGAAENVATKFKKGERGSVKADKDETHEIVEVTEPFTNGNAWKNVEKTFTVGFKERGLKKLETTTLAIIEFKFVLPQYNADVQICDIQLVAKAAK
jgi:hypothetical protein